MVHYCIHHQSRAAEDSFVPSRSGHFLMTFATTDLMVLSHLDDHAVTIDVLHCFSSIHDGRRTIRSDRTHVSNTPIHLNRHDPTSIWSRERNHRCPVCCASYL